MIMTPQGLSELITKNTRVILPNFGAFLVKDDGSGTFKPANVSFSPFLKFNDGMVEDWLCKTGNISKDEAIKQVNAFIESVKESLKEKGNFPVGNIGSLVLSPKGSIQFTTGVPESIGSQPQEVQKEVATKKVGAKSKAPVVKTPKVEPLPPVPLEEEITFDIEKQQVKKEEEPPARENFGTEKPTAVEEPAVQHPTPTKSVPPVQTAPPKPQPHKPRPPVPQPKKSKQQSSGTGRAIAIGLLIGLLFVAILAGVLFLFRGQPENPLSEMPAPTPILEDSDMQVEPLDTNQATEPMGQFDDDFERLSKEDEKTAPPPPTQKPKAQAHPQEVQAAPATMPEDSPDGRFHLIVGSFRNIEFAEKYSRDMQSSGYKSRVITQPSGMHAVTVGTFGTREQALRAMNVVKSQHPNVWLLSQ